MIVVWDGGSIHRGEPFRELEEALAGRLILERLPPYAPELNPDELVWGWSKYGRLSNLAAENTDRLRDQVIDELSHLRKRPDLLRSFMDKTELTNAA